jgi:hypothetical protein
MKTHKKQVLAVLPDTICYMSQLSGMFFVKKGRQILAYESSANSAWKQANLNQKRK